MHACNVAIVHVHMRKYSLKNMGRPGYETNVKIIIMTHNTALVSVS